MWWGGTGAFAGCAPSTPRRAATFDESLGSDWLHMAELAAAGTIRRAPTTIHRSTEGGPAHFARSLTRFAHPIAKSVAADIRTDSAYSRLGGAKRRVLA